MSDNWGHVVAVVSVLASASTAMYQSWDKGRTELAIEELKAKYDLAKTNKSQSLVFKKERCNQVTDAARSLANSYGKVYKDLDTTKKGEIEGTLWAAATMLSPDSQKEFLEIYQRGPAKDDQYQIAFTHYLVQITLRGLAIDGQKCLSEMR